MIEKRFDTMVFMGFTIKFNWVLQIQPPESLTTQSLYGFKKTGNRMFPLDTPIDLIDLNRTAMAKIQIKSFTNEGSETKGMYEVLKIYSDVEKSVLTKYWLENE